MYGLPRIIEDHRLTEQYRFPRSRKRRIRKKWARRSENHRASSKAYLLPDGTVVCHPTLAVRLRMEALKTVDPWVRDGCKPRVCVSG